MSSILPLLATLGGFASVAAAAPQGTTNYETHLPQPLAARAISAPPLPLLTPTLTAAGELWCNHQGGAHTGSRWSTLVDLGATVALERLGAPRGSGLIAQVFWVKNQHNDSPISDLTGSFNSPSGYQAGDQVRVFNLYYTQTWAEDACRLKVGQLVIDDDFIGSDYVSLFSNGAFGTTPTQSNTPLAASAGGASAFAGDEVAAPGVHISARSGGAVSWQFGLYHGGPGPDEKDNHGFEWESSSTAGAVAFLETAWHTTVAGRSSTFRFGATYHTGAFDDFSALNLGEDETTVHGLYSFYSGHDLVVVAKADNQPTLAAFWRAGLSPQQDRSVVKTYADTGLNWFGPFPGRSDDVAGIAFAWTEFGRDYRTWTGTHTLARSETAVEFTYRAQVTKDWALQGNIQLLGNTSDQTDTGNHRSATVVGLRTELCF